MLRSRNLDDQSFEDIVRAAVGKLPWLCPEWTDHNAHDPGITVLELLAWYKEMQQYHLNQFTGALEEKLLKLAGVTRRPLRAAKCAVEPLEGDGGRPSLSRLSNAEEMTFELLETIPRHRAHLSRICVRRGTRIIDAGEILGDGKLTFQPFSFGGWGTSELLLGFDEPPEGTLRLYFDVEPPEGVARNPFAPDTPNPRVLEWTCVGAGQAALVREGTHAFSQSGYVELRTPAQWSVTEPMGLCWLCVSLVDPGCEGEVRLSGISTARYQAVQQETLARSHRFTTAEDEGYLVSLKDAIAQNAELAVFLRTAEGWQQRSDFLAEQTDEGRLLILDTRGAAEDGEENLLIVCLDPVRCREMIFHADGRPGLTLTLNLGGRKVLTESFSLLCATLDRDGVVRPMEWRCVDDLWCCGPRDRVFFYDSIRETISFGDGLHGAVPVRGEGAILVTDMVLSYGGGGNIPAAAGLVFVEDGVSAQNGAAYGGEDRESVFEAARRLLSMLNSTDKCASCEDYERQAKATPGMRVAAAKALPGYDPEEPARGLSPSVVSVVVVPASSVARPMPDERFLETVWQHLNKVRTVCTRVLVLPPKYTEIFVSLQLKAEGEPDWGAVRETLEEYLSAGGVGIGGMVCRDEVAARLQALPGMLQVQRLELRPRGAECYMVQGGDLRLAPSAIPILGGLDVDEALGKQ